MIFKTLIVDDEPLARMRMKKLLEPYSDVVSLIGEASTGTEAVSLIRSLHPDLVFLDIQMPDKNGFDVLKEVDCEEDPLIVFTTAYDEYAIKAFTEDTVDYLLKPIEDERLALCMDKIRRLGKVLTGETEALPVDEFSRNEPKEHEPYLHRIQAKIGERTLIIPLENVFRFQSEEKYTTVYASNGKFIISTPLVDLEKRLDPAQFVRVHRAHLVAIDAIAEYQRLVNGHFCIRLHDKDHTVIPVSRNFVGRLHSL
jgi:two-component system, LytTR family, response regulator